MLTSTGYETREHSHVDLIPHVDVSFFSRRREEAFSRLTLIKRLCYQNSQADRESSQKGRREKSSQVDDRVLMSTTLTSTREALRST